MGHTECMEKMNKQNEDFIDKLHSKGPPMIQEMSYNQNRVL